MKNFIRIAWALGMAWVCWPVLGGTVITTNLPANTVIINISGTQDGAAGYGAAGGNSQALWYEPFNASGTLLEYTFQPGTYNFRVVDPADAARLFPALTPAQTNQIYTGWTFNSPWIENYMAFDSAAATNHSLPQLFDGAPVLNSFGNAQAAYNDAVSKGYFDEIRTGPLGRAGTVFINAYTFTNAETLIFIAPDYDLNDNSGGVSVVISPAAVLSITAGAGNVTLQWATNAPWFTLAQTTNLQPASWSDVTNAPTTVNTNYSVTLPLDATTNRFFHLHD